MCWLHTDLLLFKNLSCVMQDLASEVGIFTNWVKWVKCQEHHKKRDKYIICELVNYLKESLSANIVFKTREFVVRWYFGIYTKNFTSKVYLQKKRWIGGSSIEFFHNCIKFAIFVLKTFPWDKKVSSCKMLSPVWLVSCLGNLTLFKPFYTHATLILIKSSIN